MLNNCKALLSRGKKHTVKVWLRKVLDKYPDTSATKEAKRTLEGLD